MKLSYIFWFLYLTIYPFYVFEEGNPQIADAFGTMLIAINLKSIILKLFSNTYTKFLFFFLVLTIIINTIWMVLLGDLILLRPCLYYTYAFLLFMFVYIHLDNEKFVSLTLNTILFSLIVLFILWPFSPDQGVRTRLYFNNPNQLALWALCLLIISNSLGLIYNSKKRLVLFISLFCTFFILLSASRSASVCVFLFWMFFFVKSRKNLIAISGILILLVIIASISNLIQFDNLSTINYIIDRITGEAQPHDKGLAGRGFDRLIEFPEFLLFGSGEGLVHRFNTEMELHSIFLNVWFSYGIFGLLLFGRALISIVIESYREVIVLFLILALFGYVHMTLRIPLFWMAFGALYFVKHNRYKLKKMPDLKAAEHVWN